MLTTESLPYVSKESLYDFKIDGNEAIVQEFINNHLQNFGKLVRPSLCQLFGSWLNVPNPKILSIAKAAEYIHSASLIHDDVVDMATTRRSHPTLNTKMTNARAVLAGDFLLAQVIRDLVDVKEFELLDRLAQVLKEMVEGEFLQDELKQKMDVTQNDLIKVSQKTLA